MDTSTKIAKRIQILLVDDNPVNLTILSEILTNQGYQTRRVISGEMALKTLKENRFDLIILDIDMPQLNGYDLCLTLKENPETANIPVIFISALDDGLDKKKAFQVGGADYITKPFQVEEVIARVENQIRILDLKKNLKDNNLNLERQIQERTQELERTNQKLTKIQQQLLDKSLKDPVTNVYNKVSFMGQLRRLLEQVKSNSESCFSLLILRYHCPQFINQVLDSEVEDLIAISIASRLSDNLKNARIIARLAEHEFVAILDSVSNIEQANEIATIIQGKLVAPLYFQEKKIEIEIYCGTSLATENSHQLNNLLEIARNSAYQNEVEHNIKQDSSKLTNNHINSDYDNLLVKFEQALTNNKLIPMYQPIIHLSTSQIMAVEVSVSWLEQGDLTVDLSELSMIFQQKPELNVRFLQWMLRVTHDDLQKWQEQILWDAKLSTLNEDIKIYFKLIEEQLLFPDLVQHIAQISTNLALDSSSIILEIPEFCILKHPDLIQKILKQVSKIGFSISLDNLSTQYLVLNSQYNLPIKNIKIDSYLAKDPNDKKKLIKNLSSLTDELNMVILATNIEDTRTFEACQELGLNFGMGDLISPSISAQNISDFIQNTPEFKL